MSKILKAWAGPEELAKIAVLNVGTPFHDLETGEKIGYVGWVPEVMQETGGNFLMLKHEDVQLLLHRLATEAGAEIIFNAKVAAVTPGEPRPSITLESGLTYEGDIILGADGPNSFVREVVLGDDNEAGIPSGISVLGAVIPGELMRGDPRLEEWISNDEWPIFMGNNRSVCAHPVSAKKEFAVQLFWPDESSGPEESTADWFDVIPTEQIEMDVCGQTSDSIQKLFKLAPSFVRTRWLEYPEKFDYWSDESGRIILLGESAHPWFPGGTHGPAMALEDAAVFAALFSRLSREDQISAFVSAYQEIREARVVEVRRMDVSNAAFMRIPPGPDRDKRNENLRHARGEWDDVACQREYEGVAALFGYEALDAADEWWVNWGRFQNGNEEPEQADYGMGSLSISAR
ncbi:uncharacterized protein PHACADRAFT_264601 [Phanerochaete carnosa HHB-10118-sp]|uniref:FAD-binding domain-containing protein n=1 Tax=Phanerochaete carnosa (strain HHB-10118-sp) TaxID=650164 RepID=K5VTF5_PHACS|nr:uncharacterized protein PHACADRAFT_264601 [Phanerochaete carnosa HHB-10118-sp]EKM50080.1 hypothetical protein PHACADRAFT_264601 [Phanerochaete carnosa HHB-10118-sp]